jgi:hypothetical protein
MTQETAAIENPAEPAPESQATDPAQTIQTPAQDASSQADLSPGQQKLLTALVGDSNIQAASKAAGVARSTAYLWLSEPAFKDELARQRDAVLSLALDSVKTHATRAVTELARLLDAQDDRLRRLICNDILGRALKIRELDDLERRIVALEKAAKDKERSRHR